jgi:Alginate export
VIGAATGSGTQHFWGGYATWNFKKATTFDVYLMSLSDRGTGGNFQTFGGRYAHDTTGKGVFYNVEVALQTGQVASELLSGTDVDASGMAVEGWFGYNWKSGKNTHRIFGRLEMATGDDGTTADENEGFQPLFGDFHNRLGHGDWFRMQDVTTNLGGAGVGGGIQALSVGYTGYFQDRSEFGAAFWDYSLEEDNGGPDGLGSAIDVWYGFNYSRNVNFMVSLSQLSPDDALTGGAGAPDDSVTRLYGQARLRF